MKNDENIRVFNKWVEGHIAHDIDGMLNLLTDDVTIKSASGEKMPPVANKEEARHHWQTIYNAFPDMRIESHSTVSEDDVIFAEISHGGTMKGNMGDMEPTGKSYRVQGGFRFVFENGKIKSINTYWDPGSMLIQLGLIPDNM